MLESISREVDNAWLSGILEGEGCFISRFYNSNRRRGQELFVRVQLTNNDCLIIRKATTIMSKLGIGYYYQMTVRDNDKHNNTLVVVIQGRGRVKKLIENILPYLSGKKRQAEILLDIIKRREEMAHCYTRGQYIADDSILQKLILELKRIKHELPVNPSETKRTANFPLTWKFEDIVRTA